jgi:hypothetical protein
MLYYTVIINILDPVLTLEPYPKHILFTTQKVQPTKKKIAKITKINYSLYKLYIAECNL